MFRHHNLLQRSKSCGNQGACNTHGLPRDHSEFANLSSLRLIRTYGTLPNAFSLALRTMKLNVLFADELGYTTSVSSLQVSRTMRQGYNLLCTIARAEGT